MWARRKQRAQHCDAPGMEITVEEAEDGSAPTGLVRALGLWKLKAPRSSAVLPTCLFGYFSVFRERHRMVLPGNVRFQAGDGLLTDWCSPDFDCIDHSVAKSMRKRCVRPSPSGVGYFPSNSG